MSATHNRLGEAAIHQIRRCGRGRVGDGDDHRLAALGPRGRKKFCWCTVRRSVMSISSRIAGSRAAAGLWRPDSHVRRETPYRSGQRAANELDPEQTAIGITERDHFVAGSSSSAAKRLRRLEKSQ